jgi:diaminopimelate epimerase
MQPIAFTKLSGAGNDFIIIDHRQPLIDDERLTQFVRQVCRRRLSVGADGVILVEACATADFRWRFFNADGSRAEMCGNGARCVARWAYLNRLTGPRLSFLTDAGAIQAEVLGENVRIRLTPATAPEPERELTLGETRLRYTAINTGVPHVVIQVPDVDRVEVVALGRAIRHHATFAPAGTNVNFVSRDADGGLRLRTYERGVEDETLACGTGTVATALVMAERYALASPVQLLTRSGSRLGVHFAALTTPITDLFLEGDARVIYSGQLHPEALR